MSRRHISWAHTVDPDFKIDGSRLVVRVDAIEWLLAEIERLGGTYAGRGELGPFVKPSLNS